MKKTILFVFIQLLFVILLVSPVLSKIPVPEFYGIYLVANGKLTELKSTKVSFKVNQNGLAQIPSLDIQDSKAYFIVYQRNMNLNKLDLAKLKFLRSKTVDFQATPGFKNPYLDSKKVVNFNMWVLDGIMKLKVAPIEGKEDMYRLVPEHPLAPGVYAIPAGVFAEVEAGLGGFGGYLQSMDKQAMYDGMAYGFTVKADELREEIERKSDSRMYKKDDSIVNPNTIRARFAKDKEGIIKDSKTGLEWYVGPDRDTTWEAASSWADGLTVGGGGWRMPTRAELKGLYIEDAGKYNIGPVFNLKVCCVWSGKTEGSLMAWHLSFSSGWEDWNDRSDSTNKRGFAVRSQR